jgi:NAD+ synthase (glutamine-hydrolysing)
LLSRLGYGTLRLDAYYLRGPFSSEQTETAARVLIDELAARYASVPFRYHLCDLRGSMDQRQREVTAALAEAEAYDPKDLATAMQNVQARARTVILDIANATRSLVFTTSNMSETFTGYTTTGGDNQGGYNLLVNMPKTVIQALLEWYLAGELAGSRGLELVLAQPASAELAPEQADEQDLCPYVVLDFILYEACELKRSWRRIALDVATAFGTSLQIDLAQATAWTAKIGRLFLGNQWKREQCPVGVKLFELDLDPKTGFRFPIICYDDELKQLEEEVVAKNAERRKKS